MARTVASIQVSVPAASAAQAGRQLDAILRRKRAALAAVIERYVTLVTDEAYRRCPVDRGTLRSTVRGELKDLAGAVLAGSEEAYYARWVHDGTRRMAGNPFLFESFEVHRAGFIRDVRGAWQR